MKRGGLCVVRAELTLARDDRWPLRTVPLSPDPLNGFAVVMGRLDPGLAEEAEVCVDLLPLGAAQQRRWRGRVERADRGGGSAGAGLSPGQMWAAANGQHHRGGGRSSSARGVVRRRDPYEVGTVGARTMTREVADKAYSYDPAFVIQVLLRVVSVDRARARAHLAALIAVFGVFSASNSFTDIGVHVGRLCLGGADSWWRQAGFDRRWAAGRFAPAKRKVVTATEILGLLKPPTADCAATNVLRCGGLVPPAPRSLPTYSGQADLLPLGWVATPEGERPVGAPLAETLFTFTAGKANFGKSEGAIVRFVALAQGGHGCFFYDPHSDALARIKPYLVDVADRVLEIDLTPRGRSALQAGWNLFSMEGRGEEDIEGRVSAVVSSFAVTLGWTPLNNRALTVTTMAAQALCELNLVLPPELAATLFQMTKLLSDEEWRSVVMPFLSPQCREYFADRFPLLAAEAITPVTNLVDRMRFSAPVAALFGSSRSTYDVRRCMDEGQVVLACPAGSSDKDKLIANFLIYDVLQALLGRRNLAPEQRRPFHLFGDEMKTFDGPEATLGAILRETRKFGGRFHGMVQEPTALTESTLKALLNNSSWLLSTQVAASEAQVLAAEWAGKVSPETITQIPQYNFVGSVTLGGKRSAPFRYRGFEVSELFGAAAAAEQVDELNRTVDATMRRRPVGQVLAELDTLNERIVEHLEHGQLQDLQPPGDLQPPAGIPQPPVTPEAGKAKSRNGLRFVKGDVYR